MHEPLPRALDFCVRSVLDISISTLQAQRNRQIMNSPINIRGPSSEAHYRLLVGGCNTQVSTFLRKASEKSTQENSPVYSTGFLARSIDFRHGALWALGRILPQLINSLIIFCLLEVSHKPARNASQTP